MKARLARTQCSTLAVPLNYDDPSGPKINMAVGRLPATGAKIGSLVFNFGGPGGPGVSQIVNRYALGAFTDLR